MLKMWIGSKNKNHEILILQVHFLIVKAEDKKKIFLLTMMKVLKTADELASHKDVIPRLNKLLGDGKQLLFACCVYKP